MGNARCPLGVAWRIATKRQNSVSRKVKNTLKKRTQTPSNPPRSSPGAGAASGRGTTPSALRNSAEA
eukprot:5735472-Pyramimonas_sp.AAC.1